MLEDILPLKKGRCQPPVGRPDVSELQEDVPLSGVTAALRRAASYSRKTFFDGLSGRLETGCWFTLSRSAAQSTVIMVELFVRQSGSKLPSLSQKRDPKTLLDDFGVLISFGPGKQLHLHSLCCSLIFGFYTRTRIQVPSVATRRFKDRRGLGGNWPKMA